MLFSTLIFSLQVLSAEDSESRTLKAACAREVAGLLHTANDYRELFNFFERYRDHVEAFLRIEPTPQVLGSRDLIDSMNYSLRAGGKRLRPMLAAVAAELYEIPIEKIIPLQKALEFAHTASLIFDDLPAQDDASLRRGIPTNHRKFAESTSHNAAVALLMAAFREVQKLNDDFLPQRVREVAEYFPETIGHLGMSSGQVADLNRSDRSYTPSELLEIAHMKTGMALEASLLPVLMLAGAPENERNIIRRFSRKIGLLFQLTDDLLDLEGSTIELGKDAGADQKNKTQNYVTIRGKEETRKLLKNLDREARADLESFPKKSAVLRGLLDYLKTRTH